MLLKNYDHTITALMTGTALYSASASISAPGRDVSVQYTNGSISTSNPLGSTNDYYPGVYCPISLSSKTICIGDGDTAVTYDDYKLSGSTIGTSFTNVSNTIDFDEDTNCWVRTLTTKYTNSTDTDFVVKEWGIWRTGSYNTTAYSNSSTSVILVYRELLEEPITIAANSTATLTFTLKIPHEINAF